MTQRAQPKVTKQRVVKGGTHLPGQEVQGLVVGPSQEEEQFPLQRDPTQRMA